MAVTIDLGDPKNVHPTRKRPVGERLARWALVKAYGRRVGEASGPLIRSARREKDSVLLRFNHARSGLSSADGEPLRHFEVAGDDGVFRKARARVGKGSILVSSDEVEFPKRVRYAWSPCPDPPVNLVNASRLPASPFSVVVEE